MERNTFLMYFLSNHISDSFPYSLFLKQILFSKKPYKVMLYLLNISFAVFAMNIYYSSNVWQRHAFINHDEQYHAYFTQEDHSGTTLHKQFKFLQNLFPLTHQTGRDLTGRHESESVNTGFLTDIFSTWSAGKWCQAHSCHAWAQGSSKTWAEDIRVKRYLIKSPLISHGNTQR